MTHKWIVPVVCVAMLLYGCGPAPLTAPVLDPDQGIVNTPTAGATPRPTGAPASPTPAPTREAATLQPLATGSLSATPEIIDVTPPPTQPSNDSSNPLVDQARTDLAQRLAIDPGQIALVEFRSVVWSDGSLGCPQPGMGYTQVLVEGYAIQLAVGKRVFQYHGGQGRAPFLCENPEQPLSSGGDID